MRINADNPSLPEIIATLPPEIENRRTAIRFFRAKDYDMTPGARRLIGRLFRTRKKGKPLHSFVSRERARQEKRLQREQTEMNGIKDDHTQS
jgi:hypothetical protein